MSASASSVPASFLLIFARVPRALKSLVLQRAGAAYGQRVLFLFSVFIVKVFKLWPGGRSFV